MKDLSLVNSLINNSDPVLSMKALANTFSNEVVYSTSFGYEAQVITHMIFSNELNIEVFTLDTGRLFAETYSLWSSMLNTYKKPIKAYYPVSKNMEELISKKGPNSFYESIEDRMECCYIRKVEPLKRALKGKKIWITGIRGSQSEYRDNLNKVEWDEENQVIKYHPLLNWTSDEVQSFISKNNIAYNPLHDSGYPSIGCAPCTRAVKTGEDYRAGRWWWEDNSKRECGLHTRQMG